MNLKHLKEEQFLDIILSVENVYITYTKTKTFTSIYNHIVEMVGAKYSKEIWVFITACAKVLKKGLKGFSISLTKNSYIVANRVHGKKINRDRMSHLLSVMAQHSYIRTYTGYQGQNSCYIINDFLIDSFNSKNVIKNAPKTNSIEYIEIRDSSGNPLPDKLTKFKGICKLRLNLEEYNNLLQDHVIEVNGTKCSTTYKRVFSDNLDNAGRWYSLGGLQTMKSSYRKDIKIDGKLCTEVDYKSIHPNILYTLEGIKKDSSFDPYCTVTDRGLAKYTMLCLLNASTVHKAKLAVMRGKKVSYKDVDNVVASITEINKDISHYFGCKDLWKKLQYYDSKVTENIINTFMFLKKPILPWHDSYVVVGDDRDLLIKTMRESWVNVFGSEMNFKYEVEF